jgi:hypothetical protein
MSLKVIWVTFGDPSGRFDFSRAYVSLFPRSMAFRVALPLVLAAVSLTDAFLTLPATGSTFVKLAGARSCSPLEVGDRRLHPLPIFCLWLWLFSLAGGAGIASTRTLVAHLLW